MRTNAEIGFLIIVALLIVGVATIDLETPTANVVEDTTVQDRAKPSIELVSPDKKTTSYKKVQTFSYDVNNVDYDVTCQVIANEEVVGRQDLKPEETGMIKAELEPGYYKWSVECKLLNGRTIQSQNWRLTVSQGNMEYEQPVVTGNVVFEDVNKDGKGIFLALVAIAGLVWGVNLTRSDNK